MTPRRALLAAAALVGCVPTDPPVAEDPSDAYDVVRYDLRGAFDWDTRALSATVEIALVATETNLAAVTLDSEVTVTDVRADGRALDFTANADAKTLKIDLTPLALADEGAAVTLEVDYTAPESPALRTFPARAGDPLTSRVVYTFSEPQDVPKWMPCNNRPDDRAEFAVELTVAADESVIANGDLERDVEDGDGRRMRWATDYTLPPYLMAFAAGPFDPIPGSHGDLPIGVWRRPGLPGDHDRNLAELDRLIGLFEGMLGPYPFEKYQLVLLPGVGGGIEHAGITFQTETGSSEPLLLGDLSLTAHELAHQWWGDLVTVDTWDDVWIKEGLATFFAAQGLRAAEDQSDAGMLMGDQQYAYAGEAVRDFTLEPPDKYTSGPYGRSAWLFTQVRAVAGDDAFFATLRDLRDDHAFGTITTDQIVAAFAPHLGDDGVLRLRSAIDVVDLPQIFVEPGPDGGAVVTLADPDASLVAPIALEWRRAGGDVERLTLAPDEPLALTKNDPGDHLLIDPDDVHVRLSMLLADDPSVDSYYADLMPLLLPEGDDLLAAFAALPGPHQRLALVYAGLPAIAPEQLPALTAGLHSAAAEAIVLREACDAAVVAIAADPAAEPAWVAALTAAFTAPDAPLAGIGSAANFNACADIVDPLALFADEWSELAAGLETPTISDPRLLYLSRFELPPADALEIWAPVVRRAHALRSRATAANKLYAVIDGLDPDAPETFGPWHELVLELLADHRTSEVLGPTIYAAGRIGRVLDPTDLLAAFSVLLHDPVVASIHARTLCTALDLSPTEAAWTAFVADLDDAPLSRRALEILADPTHECA